MYIYKYILVFIIMFKLIIFYLNISLIICMIFRITKLESCTTYYQIRVDKVLALLLVLIVRYNGHKLLKKYSLLNIF